MPGATPSALGSVLSKPSPRARARRAAVLALDSVLVLGPGAAVGVWMSSAASASTSTPGWAAAQGPTPAGITSPESPSDSYLSGESCVSAAFCGAIGGYQDSSYDDHGYLDVFTGGQWTSVLAPLPSDARTSDPDPYFDAISCPSDGSCVAVGSYIDTSGYYTNLIETLVNDTWIPASTALPALGATDPSASSELTALWCNTDDSCVAAGYYTYASGTRGLIDTLSGGHWLATDAPAPSDASHGEQHQIGFCVVFDARQLCGHGQILQQFEFPLAGAVIAKEWQLDGARCFPSTRVVQQTVRELLRPVFMRRRDLCLGRLAYKDSSENAYGLISTYSNGSWTTIDAPEPSNAGTGPAQYAGLDDC